MSFRKRNNFLVFLLLTAITVIFTLPGCKEGTESSPVSSLLTGAGSQLTNLPEVTDETLAFDVEGSVISVNTNEKLANINIGLYYNGGLARQTRSTSEGKFFFSKLPPGQYDIIAALNDANYSSGSAYIEILSDGRISPNSPTIYLEQKTIESPTGEIQVNVTGQVVKIDTNEKLNNLEVQLEASGTLITSSFTDINGEFIFKNLNPGDYALKIVDQNQIYVEKSSSFKVLSDGTVTPKYPIIQLAVRAIESFMISGYLRTQTNEIVSDVEVTLKNADGGLVDKQNTTGEGKFFFENLKSGFYYLQAAASTRLNTKQSNPFPIQILTSGEVSPATIEIAVEKEGLVETANIYGHIMEAFSGAPIEYAKITLGDSYQNLTDNHGRFEFDTLKPGIYALKVEKDGFDTLNTSILIPEIVANDSQTASFTFTLIQSIRDGYGSIAGRLVDPTNGNPLPGLNIQCYKYVPSTKQVVEMRDGKAYTKEVTYYEVETSVRLYSKTVDVQSTETVPQELEGTFKLTHLEPGFYYIIFYESTYSPTFVYDTKGYTFLNPATLGWRYLSMVGDVYNVQLEVAANKTTFWTNYEREKN